MFLFEIINVIYSILFLCGSVSRKKIISYRNPKVEKLTADNSDPFCQPFDTKSQLTAHAEANYHLQADIALQLRLLGFAFPVPFISRCQRGNYFYQKDCAQQAYRKFTKDLKRSARPAFTSCPCWPSLSPISTLGLSC